MKQSQTRAQLTEDQVGQLEMFSSSMGIVLREICTGFRLLRPALPKLTSTLVVTLEGILDLAHFLCGVR